MIFASGWNLIMFGFLGWMSSVSDTGAGASLDCRISSGDLVCGEAAGIAACLVSKVPSSGGFGRGPASDEVDCGGMESDGGDCSGCCSGVAAPGAGTDDFNKSSSVGFTGAGDILPVGLISALLAASDI